MALRIFSAFVLVLASIFFVPTAAAQTTTNAGGYSVDKVTLNPYPESLTPEGGLYAWSGVELLFDWSAPPSGVRDGDEFVIKFPSDDKGEPLLALKQSKEFDLVEDDGSVGGHCVAQEQLNQVTCNVDSRFVNKDDVRGTVRVAAATREANDKIKGYDFTIGSGTVRVDVPGGKGITGRPSPFPTSEFKAGWPENDGKTLTWALYVPGHKLAALNGGPLEITDSIPEDGGPHSFQCAPEQGYIVAQGPKNYRVQALAFPDSPDVLQDLDNNAKSHLGVVDQEFSDDYKTMTLKINAPADGWKADEGYRIKYHTCFTQDVDSATFKNNAYSKVADFGVAVAEYKDDASGTIQGVDRGSYKITKKIATGSAKIPSNQVFNFTVHVDSPNDAFDETKTVSIKADDSYTGDKVLPVGTTVTVKEEEPKAAGLEFDAPTYEASADHDPKYGDHGVTVKIRNDKNAEIVVTNKATAVPQPLTPTPGDVGSGGSSEFGLLAGLLAIPLIAGIVGSSGSSQPAPSQPAQPAAPAPAAPTTQKPVGKGGVAPAAAPTQQPVGNGGVGNGATPTPAVKQVAPKQAPAQAAPVKAEKTLANTGSRVIEIFAIALAVMVLGILLVVRARRSRSRS